MLNHIGVMLRGHVRTWRWIYPYVFKFYDKLAYNVDYYFISWHGSELNTNIWGSFEGRNLISCQYIKENSEINYSYATAAYMSHYMLPYKHKRERTVSYDMFIDSRPDVLPFLNTSKFIYKPEPNILYTTQFELHKNQRHGYYDIAIADWFLAGTSKVHDAMCDRYIEMNDQSSQITIRNFAEDCGFSVNLLNYVRAEMCRPNIYEAIEDNKVEEGFIKLLGQQWTNMSSEQKIKILEQRHIPINDYNTGSGTCSI